MPIRCQSKTLQHKTRAGSAANIKFREAYTGRADGDHSVSAHHKVWPAKKSPHYFMQATVRIVPLLQVVYFVRMRGSLVKQPHYLKRHHQIQNVEQKPNCPAAAWFMGHPGPIQARYRVCLSGCAMSIAFLRIQKRKFAESLGAVKHAAEDNPSSWLRIIPMDCNILCCDTANIQLIIRTLSRS